VFGLKKFRFRTFYNPSVRVLIDELFGDMEKVTAYQQLTVSPKDFIVLCEIVWRKGVDDPERALERMVEDSPWFHDFNVILTQGRRTLCMIIGVYNDFYTEVFLHTTREYLCFLEYPIELSREHATGHLVGPPKEVEKLMEFLKEFDSPIELVASSGYQVADRGILAVLTDRQKEVMEHAYREGFFDHPRKKDARAVAEGLGMKHTTFLTHVRKSHCRLLGALFDRK